MPTVAPVDDGELLPTDELRVLGASYGVRDVEVETDEEEADAEEGHGGVPLLARAARARRPPFARRRLFYAKGDCRPGLPDEMIEQTDRTADQAGHQPRRDGAAWWTHARCNDGSGRLVAVFFSQELQDIARAKRLCVSCPALIPCLEGALERREPGGVSGGQLFLDGKIVATKRRRGRPPKVPRPEDQLPEVPLPEHLRGVPVVRIA